MEHHRLKRCRERGFTLAELLIVVAIIAVLVAVAIPVFMAELEKSRESTDLANVREMYAEVMTAAVSEDAAATYDGAAIYDAGKGTFSATYAPLKLQIDGWTMNVDEVDLGNVPSGAWEGQPKAGGSCTVTYDLNTEIVTIKWDEGAAGGGKFGETERDALKKTLLSLLTAGNNGQQKLTVTITDGVISLDHHGNPHNDATEANIKAAIESIDGVSVIEGKIYFNGKLMNDSVYVEGKNKDKDKDKDKN